MFKFEYKGETFTIRDYIIYNANMEPIFGDKAKELCSYYVNSLNFNNMDKELVYSGIRFTYIHKAYEDIPRLVRIYFDREDVEPKEKKVILPKLAEIYRLIGNPQKTVNLFQYLREFYGDYLLTSELVAQVAHALCDLGKFEDAKATCEWAYTLRHPNLEAISEVYMRIQKQLDE